MMETFLHSFLTKFDKVLDLLQHGHLRQDIDDTLLQKLVTFLHCGSAHFSESKSDKLDQDYIKEIHEKLARHCHVETFLIEVLKSPSYIDNPQACVFGLQLLAVLTKELFNIFLHEDKKRILICFMEFQMSCILDASPSVQVAALQCLSSITQHHEGFLWLAQQGLFDVGLKYLSAASLYVRKSVVDFLSCSLIMWYHSFDWPTKPDISMEKVLRYILQTISANNVTQHQNTEKESCIKIIKETIKHNPKICSWLCKEFHLLDILQNTIESNTDVQSVQAAVDLILSLFDHQISRNADFETSLENILIRDENFEVLINFLSFVLQRYYIQHQDLSQRQFALVCSPLVVLTGMHTSISVSQEVAEMLQKRMSEKETCRKLVRMSLLSVSKLISRLENQILKEIISVVTAVLQPKSDQWNQIHLQRHIVGCKKTRHAACELLINCVQPPVKNELDATSLLSLVDTFLFLLNSPTTDSQLMNHSIQGVGALIILEASGKKWLSPVILDQLAEILHRRLADPRWAVVDSSLQLLDCLSAQEIAAAEQTLLEWLCQHKFPCIVWDIVFSEIDGYVKATAINALTSFCLSSPLWTYLKEQKDSKEDDVVMHFLKLVTDDPDTFVRRAAISSLFRLLQVDALNVKTTHSSTIYKVLMIVSTTDLDWEVKLQCLKVWQWVLEQNLSLVSETMTNFLNAEHSEIIQKIGSFLKILHSCGYGPSLTNALRDHDRTVQQQAAEYLLELCLHLEHLGWSPQVSLNIQEDFKLSNKNINEVNLSSTQTCEDSSTTNSGISIPATDRAEILEEVLDIDTFSQIHQIIKVVPSVSGNLGMGDISNKRKHDIEHFVYNDDQWIAFVQALSKKQLEALLLNLHKSTDVYNNEPVSLLEDIIAAASQNSEIKNEDFKAMDCY